MKRLLAPILVLILITLSGCTNTPAITQGVIVKTFEFQPSQIYDVDKAYLKLTLENQGKFLVKNIYVDIYGLGNDWGIIDVQGTKKIELENPSRLDIDANFRLKKEYQIADNNIIISGDVHIEDIENILKGESPNIGIENLDVFILRDDISIYIENLEELTDLAYKNNYQRISDLKLNEVYKKAPKIPPVFIDYLAPVLPDQNFPGESIDLYWVVEPPSNLPANSELIKDVHARICFQTEQTLSTKVNFIHFNEMLNEEVKRTKKTKKLNGFVTTIVEYEDPVVMDGPQTPLIFKVTFENNGPGIVTQESCKEVIKGKRKDYANKINQIKFEVRGFNCEIKDDKIYVPSTKSLSFIVYCTAETPQTPRYSEDLDIKIIYSYYYDVTTQVKVIGTKR